MISVIVPVYNSAPYLSRCLDSIIDQTYKDTEIILIVSPSSDNSHTICTKYALIDNRIKIFITPPSSPSIARNIGLENSSGEYIYFIDSDDYIASNTLELSLQFNSDLVLSNFSKLNIDNKIIIQPDNFFFNPHHYLFHFLTNPSNHLMSYCWARLYKSSIIKSNNIKFNESLHLFEDFLFNLEYLSHTSNISYIPKPLYTYVMHNVSASMSIINANSLIHDMQVFKEKTLNFNPHVEKEIHHCLIHYAIIFLVRTCHQITPSNKYKIFQEIEKLINSEIIITSLKDYHPTNNTSTLVPLLMKLKLTTILMIICKYKGNKRYGKL